MHGVAGQKSRHGEILAKDGAGQIQTNGRNVGPNRANKHGPTSTGQQARVCLRGGLPIRAVRFDRPRSHRVHLAVLRERIQRHALVRELGWEKAVRLALRRAVVWPAWVQLYRIGYFLCYCYRRQYTKIGRHAVGSSSVHSTAATRKAGSTFFRTSESCHPKVRSL